MTPVRISLFRQQGLPACAIVRGAAVRFLRKTRTESDVANEVEAVVDLR